MIDFTWNLGESTEVHLSTSYAASDAAFDSLNVMPAPDVPLSLFPGGQLPGPGPDPGSPLSVSDLDFSMVHDYSNLEYTEVRTTLGLRHQVNESLGLFGSLSYYDMKDDQPYLQDATGSVTLVSGGLSWSF